MLETHYAPAERAPEEELRSDISRISANPIVNEIMASVSGLLAVLNEQRQVLVVNDELLAALRVEDPEAVHGLRPGEFIQCIHAQEPPHGCGTTKSCASCGAAIAMVTSLTQNRPVEQTCAVTTKKNGTEEDLFFLVRSSPVTMGGKRFLFLFMRNVTQEHRREALEKTFFHDINNLLSGILGMSELLLMNSEGGHGDLEEEMYQQVVRMAKEVGIQRLLLQGDPESLQVDLQNFSLAAILQEAGEFSSRSGCARGKKLSIIGPVPPLVLDVDSSLVLRILKNMLTNALEASEEGDEVRLWAEENEGGVDFCVWNRKAIPEKLAGRIFQQHFSTKNGQGRGFGTHSIKLIGEKVLNGKVAFSTSEEKGTTFRFSLPACYTKTEG